MLGIFGTIAAAYMLVTGSVPLRFGRSGPYNPWIRAAGGVLLVGIWLPMDWLGVIFGAEEYGRPIVLVIGLIVLVIGIVNSFSRPA